MLIKMKSNIFYGKRTIIIFIVLLAIFMFICPNFYSFIGMFGAGTNYGVPFEVYYSNVSLGPSNQPRFSWINLILDLVIYYITALIISLLISKARK